MIYHICPSCDLPKGVLGSRTSAMMNVCRCEPYTPVIDRGHPDTAATEIQRLIDLVASQGREITAFKRAARERDLELLSDATQYQCMLEAKDAEIATMREAIGMAYGHLWCVNEEPLAPVALYSKEKAAYAARKLLRDTMTSDQRGRFINRVVQTVRKPMEGSS